MASSTQRPEPPYLRIVGVIRGRIASGRLGAGDRVPSTRQIVEEWGVAMATATKVLTALRNEGLVEAVPGSGTVVSARRTTARPPRQAPPRPAEAGSQRESRDGEPGLNQDRVVRTAIEIADAEGQGALTMRRVAAELGVGAMSLYRYVPGKDELVRLMADAAFGEHPLPEPGPDGWRAKLELVARLQWDLYRRHPWLASSVLTSLTRPPVVPNAMGHVDWELRALDGLGLDMDSMLNVVITVNGYVGGIAVSRAIEVETEQDSGISSEQRWVANAPMAAELFASGRFPMLSRLTDQDHEPDLDGLFEFGLQRQLDGIAAYLVERKDE